MPIRPIPVVSVPVLALALVAATAGCGDEGGEVGSDADSEVVMLKADVERAEPAAEAPVAEVVAGIDTFALEAERLLAAETGGNTVLSPTSIAVAFAMVSAGADEATARQIAGVFGFRGAPEVHQAMNSLTTSVAGADLSDPERGDVVVDMADSVWAQTGFDVDPGFLDTLAAEYGAGLPTTDFESDPEGSRAAINDSVAAATRDRIPDLLPEGSVTDDTRVVVVDAIYLKAPWETDFDPELTAPGPFHLADGSTADVPMMHDGALSTRAVVADGYTAVELPYFGGELAMLLVVPTGTTSLDDVLVSVAGAGGLGAVADRLGDAMVDLTVPTWDTGSAADLAPIMTDLGLPIPGGALPGIAPDLEISAAVHAADITVDEAGTEAAAATAVGIGVTSAPLVDEIVTVVADRPYLFAVRHVETGAPLFVGRVADPGG